MTKEIRYRDFQTAESADGAMHMLSFTYDRDNCKNQCVREERKLYDMQVQTIIYE